MRRSPGRSFATVGAILVAAALVACGSGSVTSTPQAAPTGSGAASQSVTTSTTGTTSIPAVTSAGVTSTVVLPIANAAVTITESISTTPPGGIPALAAGRASVEGERRTQSGAPPAIIYIGFVPRTSVTLDGTPAVTFALPSITVGAAYYLAVYSTSGWVFPSAGPGAVSGSSVAFASSTSGTTLTPSAPLYVALYSVAAATSPSPSLAPSAMPSVMPSPSPSPSPSPTPTPVAAPTTLTFSANAPSTQSFTVTESGDTAVYTASIGCTASSPSPVASPPAASPAPSPSASPFVAVLDATTATPTGGVGTFMVTSGTQLGTCIVTVTTASSQTAHVTVNVDETAIGVYSTGRMR